MTATFAVITTYRREQALRTLVDALAPQVDGIVLVNNGDPDDLHWMVDLWRVVSVRNVDMDPPNISALANIGIGAAEAQAANLHVEEWDLCYLNDDVRVPPDWVTTLAAQMRPMGAAAAFVDPWWDPSKPWVPRLLTERPTSPMQAMTGWAFMARGELGERWDESMAWWWSDTDLDWRYRALGGVVVVPGTKPVHLSTNEHLGRFMEQAGRDRATFAAKWGGSPW